MLWHWSEGRVGKEQFMRMTDWDILNWVTRPDANAGRDPWPGYWPVERDPEADPNAPPPVGRTLKEACFLAWRSWQKRGWTEEEMEARFKELYPSYEVANG